MLYTKKDSWFKHSIVLNGLSYRIACSLDPWLKVQPLYPCVQTCKQLKRLSVPNIKTQCTLIIQRDLVSRWCFESATIYTWALGKFGCGAISATYVTPNGLCSQKRNNCSPGIDFFCFASYFTGSKRWINLAEVLKPSVRLIPGIRMYRSYSSSKNTSH